MSFRLLALHAARLPARLRVRSASRRACAPRAAQPESAAPDDAMAKPRFTPAEFVVDKTDAFASLQLRSIADEVRAGAARRNAP